MARYSGPLAGLGGCLPKFRSTSLVVLSGKKSGGGRRVRVRHKTRARTSAWYKRYVEV